MSDVAATGYRPVLVVPTPRPAEFQPRGGGSTKTARPTRDRQGERLDDAFDELERVLSGSASASVTDALPDGDPELVVVFEVVETTSDLAEALHRAGLEPLLDVEDEFDDADLGTDFARLSAQTDEPIKRFLHATMANEEAVAQLLKLWRHWRTGERMLRNFSPFTALFNQLYDVRPWGPADRIRSTGLSDQLALSIAEGLAEVPVAIELWFRANAEHRAMAQRAVTAVVTAAGGQVLRTVERVEIGYHAIAAVLPTGTLAAVRAGEELSNLDQVALLRSVEVLFIRPGGQGVGVGLDADLPIAVRSGVPALTGPPLLAVLDGLPAANHPLLQNRLEVVDPDDMAGDPTYTVDRRRHGTMVASAVVWGDRGANEEALDRAVVVRPVLRPDLQTQDATEIVPWDELPADVTIRAVRDILGDENAPGAWPTVKVFNLSLGDPLAQFDTIPSAWARAIDWLSWKYDVLFVVSAGNHASALPLSGADVKRANGVDRDQLTKNAIAGLSGRRRLLPPAESLNALTVGALHSDAAGEFEAGYRLDLWGTEGQPSPITAHGRGIRRAIKPDLAAPGGRQLFTAVGGEGAGFVEPARGTARPPGIEVAAPPDRSAFVCGTTFAAAEVARRGSRIAEMVQVELAVPERFVAVATKALLVHGTSYPHDATFAIPTDRLVGHGSLVRDLTHGCLPSQATMLFVGELGSRQEVELVVPFPHDVAIRRDLRRVSATLAWLSPTNWNHRQYRRAKLTFDGPSEIKSQHRDNRGPGYHLTRRGTVEHRTFETERAFSVDQLSFTVKATDQAGGFDGTVPFSFAVSLEVGSGIDVDVYELVRAQLRARARIV